VVTVSQVPGREEDHVQITVANRSGRSGSAIQKNGGKMMLAHSVPYMARQLSAFGPTRVLSQRVNQCCVSLL
jgi:hypothetical protein